MTTHMNVELSVPVLDVATTAAALAGVGLQEWITQAIAEKASAQAGDQAADLPFDDCGMPSYHRAAV
ncbi:hypothetical protein ABZ215_24990 [Amycolatopsis sp. NPDC006131]|uniref:hypothetical protein n=1 Tax=Amycolatopsis sp. NPDC006131 TaxID=3156731 RepID=UPI0033A18CFB